MPSSKEYFTYVMELLREIRGISYKKMMGEYILYKDNIIFGGVYDNRFLVKKTKSLVDRGLEEQTPYPGAKPMLLVDTENPEEIKVIVDSVIKDIKTRR